MTGDSVHESGRFEKRDKSGDGGGAHFPAVIGRFDRATQ
jgi:hypothetical protein